MLPKKALGQHFLKNPSLLRKLISDANICEDDTVVEIGAGDGALTKLLLERAGKVYAVELDKVLFKTLLRNFGDHPKLKLIHGDFLKLNLLALSKEARARLRIVANIPYKITSPLLIKFLKEREAIKDCHIMMQREVAERIKASPGKEGYGSLSVLIQASYHVSVLKFVKSGSFFPVPGVESAFVQLLPLSQPQVEQNEYKKFSEFLRIAFSQRRKTLKKILNSINIPEAEKTLLSLGIKPTARPGEIPVMDFVNLTRLCGRFL